MPGGPGKTHVFGDTLYDLIWQMIRQEIGGFAMDSKLNLGGKEDVDGGSGQPPAGFSGQLAQRYITYDLTEGERMGLLNNSGWDNSLVDNLNHIRYWEKAAKWFQPHFDDSYEVTVYGGMYWTDADTYLDFQGDTITVTVPDQTGDRIDVIYVDTGGTLNVSTGTPSGTPSPTYPALSHLPVCELYVKQSGTPGVTYFGLGYEYASGTHQGYLYKDVRPYFGQNTALGTVTYLADLLDVSSESPDHLDVLTYNEPTANWRPMAWLMGGIGGGQPTLQVDGPLSTLTHVGGAYICTRSGTINSVYIYCETPGLSGSTIADVNVNGTTIFDNPSNRPTLVYNDANKVYKALLASGVQVIAEDLITVDIDQIATEAANLTVVVALDIDQTHSLSDSSHTGVLKLEDLQDGLYSGYPLLSQGKGLSGGPAYGLLTSLGIGSDAITYNKIGTGGLKGEYRQGGDASDWSDGGTTNYSITGENLKVQTGSADVTVLGLTGTNPWKHKTSLSITFPSAFSNIPVVFAVPAGATLAGDNDVNVSLDIVGVTTAGCTIYVGIGADLDRTFEVMWYAVGEE
jgi:hypothetical protein